MNTTILSKLGLVALFTLATGCAYEAAEEAPVESAEAPLIGGTQALPGQFDATIKIRYGCTASRVGPRQIVTAAHCVMNVATGAFTYATGTTLQITNSKVDDSTVVYHSITLASVKAHPVWMLHCRSGCSNNVSLMNPFPPDIAVLTTNADLPSSIPQAFVDATVVPTGTAVTVAGAGCEQFVGGPNPSPGRLKLEPTFTQSTGSKALDARYIATPGKTQDSEEASLCPGDSGGPLWRGTNGSVHRLVGVNAYYTFTDDSNISHRNTHTRITGNQYVIGDIRWPSVVEFLQQNIPANRFLF